LRFQRAVAEAEAVEADGEVPGREAQLAGGRFVGCEDVLAEDAGREGRGMGAVEEQVEIVGQAGGGGDLLDQRGLGGEVPFAAADFDEPAVGQVLDRLADRGAAQAELLHQARLRWQLSPRSERAVRDVGN
jgi:hypothetical protein